MIIQEVHVKNFRSILDEKLPCDSLTALVGRNGSGKSSFLSAIELFYDPTPRVTVEDFYSEEVTQDIEISITFGDLSDDEGELFSKYVEDKLLTVVRVFSNTNGKTSDKYHGMRLQNPEFSTIRKTEGAQNIRSRYSDLRKISGYSLPSNGYIGKQCINCLE